jgi:hypothetical protein
MQTARITRVARTWKRVRAWLAALALATCAALAPAAFAGGGHDRMITLRGGVLVMGHDPFRHPPDYPDLAAAGQRQVSRAQALYDRTRAAAARRFPTATAAVAAGYRPRREEAKDTLLHLNKRSYYRDRRVLDPMRPESLVYWHSGVRWELVGVMYRASSRKAPPRTGAPKIARWHVHGGCRAGRPRPGDRYRRVCPRGMRLAIGGTLMMHVWLTNDLRSAFAMGPPDAELESDLGIPPPGPAGGDGH